MDHVCTLQKLLADAESHSSDEVWPNDPLKLKALRIFGIKTKDPEPNPQLVNIEINDGTSGARSSNCTSEDERLAGDPFAPADFDSEEVRCASEHDLAEAMVWDSDEAETGYEEIAGEDDGERMSRREWFELDQLLARDDKSGWTSDDSWDVEGELAERMGNANWRIDDPNNCDSSPVESDSSASRYSGHGTPKSLESPTEKSRRSDADDEILKIRNQEQRFDHCLDRCIWRVEDLIGPAEQILASKPASDEIEMYVEPMPGRKEGAFDQEAQYTEKQCSLMQDIDRLLDGLDHTAGQASARTTKAQEKQKTPMSQIPKLTSHKTVKKVARSQLPTAIRKYSIKSD
ncbi:MAG: hypothetical protein Q9164_001465 [Protoblastenia rupestris]